MGTVCIPKILEKSETRNFYAGKIVENSDKRREICLSEKMGNPGYRRRLGSV